MIFDDCSVFGTLCCEPILCACSLQFELLNNRVWIGYGISLTEALLIKFFKELQVPEPRRAGLVETASALKALPNLKGKTTLATAADALGLGSVSGRALPDAMLNLSVLTTGSAVLHLATIYPSFYNMVPWVCVYTC